MEKLLALLSDREFHSGEEMGQLLGISRAAVWKKIKGLQDKGLQLESVRGKGYRLEKGIELFDEKAIRAGLEKDVRRKISLHSCVMTSSTNDLVQEVCKKHSNKKLHFCLAEYQTTGRGRRGRRWFTPFGSNICLSLMWQLGDGTASLEGLSLAAGLAVLKALESCGIKGLELKWPNDVLWQGKKVCGVLLEAHGDPTGDCNVVIGVGVNVRLSDEQLASIGQPAVDLYRIYGGRVSRNQVASELINTICHMLEGYREGGFPLFREQWSHYDAFLGQMVSLDASGQQVTGRSLGVNEQGGLLLETESGRMVFHGGEVSLRPY